MTKTIRFGIALQSNKTPAEYVAQATAIDRHKFDVVSVYNDLLFQPAFGPLLLMAPHLSTARLGPAALNPYTLHPAEIAGQVAVLDLATEGRAYVGLARGSWLDRLGIAQRRPVQTMRECVLLIRQLLAGITDGFSGEVFKLAPGHALQYAVARQSVPITIGAWGRQMARLAGEVADEVKIGGSANPSMAAFVREAIRAGETAAGRRPGGVGICLGAVTVVDHDRARARDAARREVAVYAPIVAPLDPTLCDDDWLARIAVPSAQGDLQAVADLIPDAVLDRLAFAGSPADVARQVEDIVRAGAGVTRVEFGTPHGLDPFEGIRLLGERVLPSFQS